MVKIKISRKLVFALVIAISILLISVFLYNFYVYNNSKFYNSQERDFLSTLDEKTAILFWSVGCPHCHYVLTTLKERPELERKLNIIKLEVSQNQTNAELFYSVVKYCNLRYYGVPLLFHNNKCILGRDQVIEYLENL